jgi:hypothetical protein
MTSESTRFLGQPRETKPTIGLVVRPAAGIAAGAGFSRVLVTSSIVPGAENWGCEDQGNEGTREYGSESSGN